MISTSGRFQFDAVDFFKTLRTAVIALLATFVLGGLEALLHAAQGGELCSNTLSFASHLCKLDFTQSLFVSGTTSLLEAGRRFFTDHTK